MLAIINPIGLVPLWSELTNDTYFKVRQRLGILIIGFSIIVLIMFLIGGEYILNFFSIDLTVFKVAGGILLLITGIKRVEGKDIKLQDKDDGEGSTLQMAKNRFRKILMPMGIPSIVGPGSITTVMVFGSGNHSITDYGMLSVILIGSSLILLLTLISSAWLEKKVDAIAFTAITRLFGIIVTAIALQFMLEGLGDIFPNWVDHTSPVIDSNKNGQALSQ